MVSPLDLGLFQHFDVLFAFLFIFLITFGALSFVPMFKDKRALQLLIALVLGFMTLFSDIALNTITTAAPWFVLMFFFIIFILITVMLFGVKETDIMGAISGEHGYILKTVIILGIIIALGSLMQVVAERGGLGEPHGITEGGEITIGEDGTAVQEFAPQEKQFWDTVAHPKVLGLVLILVISMFAVLKLSHEAG